MKAVCILLTAIMAASISSPLEAAAKDVRVKPSKVILAKSRDREKLFTEWTAADAFAKLSDSKTSAGEQLIYYEYHEGKGQFRGIFSKAIKFNGWWRFTVSGEKEMESRVNEYKDKGYEPLFVVLEGNYYCMIFVRPDQLEAARKLVLDLGIESPVLK